MRVELIIFSFPQDIILVIQGYIAKQLLLCFLFEKVPGAKNPFLEDLHYFELPNQ